MTNVDPTSQVRKSTSLVVIAGCRELKWPQWYKVHVKFRVKVYHLIQNRNAVT
jgi:hypothetical protein